MTWLLLLAAVILVWLLHARSRTERRREDEQMRQHVAGARQWWK